MDPLSIASMVVGSATLAVEVFKGVKKGYEYFESAFNMPAECEPLRLRLRIEYTRLLDWGDLAGLSEEQDHHSFDRKLQSNRATIIMILSEIRLLLRMLRKMSLVYGEVESKAKDKDDKSGVGLAPDISATPNSEDTVQMVFREATIAEDPTQETRTAATTTTTTTTTIINLESYRDLFKSRKFPLRTRRQHMTGLNHVIKLSQNLKNIATNPHRIVWALKDKENFQAQLRRLKELTDFLHESLGETQMQVLTQTMKETCMAMLQLTNSVGDMRELLKAFNLVGVGSVGGSERGETEEGAVNSEQERPRQLSRTSTLAEPCVQDEDGNTVSSTTPENLQTMFEKLASFGVVSLEIHGAGKIELKQRKLDDEQLLNLELTDDEPDCDSRTLGTYSGQPVWVEWKAYQVEAAGVSASGEPKWDADSRVVENVERLVALLCEETKPAEFRIPPCLGYFRDEKNARFGIIFPLPASLAPRYSGPRSLLQRLVSEKPATIRGRMNIAREIAKSLSYLHAVKWLHKGLRSDNILFFSEDEEPYISGFEYSRPDGGNMTTVGAPDEWEWAVYAHPDYIGPEKKSYRRTYDIYSFGIILLEIAYWRKAEDLLGLGERQDKPAAGGRPFRKSLSQMRKTRARLLYENPELLDYVRNTMGDLYYHVVRACIEGLPSFKLPKNVDETDPVIGALLQQAYLRLVVGVLQSITI